jgi:hypothetical protein
MAKKRITPKLTLKLSQKQREQVLSYIAADKSRKKRAR